MYNMGMSRVGFAHSELAHRAVMAAAEKIKAETGCTWNEAIRQACTTLEGAANGRYNTVESVHTCRDIGRKSVSGLTTDSIPGSRTDPFVRSEYKRMQEAEAGLDEAARWLKENDPKYSSSDNGKAK